MKKLFAAVAVSLVAGSVFAGEMNERDFRIRDPFVLVEGGKYYMYESKPWSGGTGVYVRVSTNLVDWTAKKTAMALDPSVQPTAVWAPEVHRYGGKFYLFTTVTQKKGVRPMKAMGKGVNPGNLTPRGTWAFVADSPLGPFVPVKNGPVPPAELQTLDGTLVVEDGKPYMVYCHEWCQVGNGTIAYAPLSADLSSFLEPPKKMLDARSAVPGAFHITDGPFFYRSRKSSRLYMIWSNAVRGNGYCVLVRSSPSGRLAGPWTKDELLFGKNGGHGMIFRDLAGRLLLTFHQPNKSPEERMKVVELDDDGEKLTIRKPVKCLLLAEGASDFSAVLESCGADIVRMKPEDALHADLSPYDAYCILGEGVVLDSRLRERLEAECARGKKCFTEALGSWSGIYSAPPVDTTRSRLVVVTEKDNGIPGLAVGDLLDDGSNRMVKPHYNIPGMKVLLAYRTHIIAHRHWKADRNNILKGSTPGLWLVGDNLMMTSFEFRNYNRARFAPREAWNRLVVYIAKWITGREPARLPEPLVRYGAAADLTDDAAFETCRKQAVERGIRWLERYLVDEGRGGIREGLSHSIDPDGVQRMAKSIRTDCAGEAAGAFRFYGELNRNARARTIADNLTGFVYGPMQVKGGLFDGMLRWTETAWQVCYQDDAARAVLPALYACLYFGDRSEFPAVCRALDFLVKTTAKDGCRVARTDAPRLDEKGIKALAAAKRGLPSAHYNAYYHAALLLAYQVGGNRTYLDTGRRGLETIMSIYPNTKREQSETQELCRLILPLAVLYKATGEKRHRDMLYRVTNDLLKHRHPSGGFAEWDTGYKAACSRVSRGECSLLTENGDPVADLLYSVNWLPIGFAVAYDVTKDEKFRGLWRDVAAFCLKAQVYSNDPKTDGSWCRAFDMEIGEAYGCPHDVGWAARCSESGWTNAEILMGLMMPEVLARAKKQP